MTGQSTGQATSQGSPTQLYATQPSRMPEAPQQTFHFPASPNLPAHPQTSDNEYQVDPQGRNSMNHQAPNGNAMYAGGYVPLAPNHASELDAHYWKNMFIELGFGENVDPNNLPGMIPGNVGRPVPQHYMEHTQTEQQQQSPLPPPSHHNMAPQPQPIHYHAMHVPSYGH